MTIVKNVHRRKAANQRPKYEQMYSYNQTANWR